MAKKKAASAAPPALPESDLRGEAKLGDYILVLDMDAIDRFEGGGDRSMLDLLSKFRYPAVFGMAKLSDLVDVTRCAMLAHHADDLPDRAAVLALVNGPEWTAAFKKALARAFPAEGEPVPAS